VVPQRDPRHRTAAQILAGETPDPVDIPAGCRFRGRCPIAEDRCATIDPRLAPVAGSPPAGAAEPSGGPAGGEHRVACLLAATA
jgi:oligopeptide/dipeptide ABC transporter ATP-binding protein